MYAGLADGVTKINEAQTNINKNLATANKSLADAQNELKSYNLSETQQAAFNDLRELVITYPSLTGNLDSLQKKSDRLKEIGARLVTIGSMSPDEQVKYAEEARNSYHGKGFASNEHFKTHVRRRLCRLC